MIQEYLQKMKMIHQNLLEYIYGKDNIEEKYQNLIKLLDDNQICENKYDLELFIHLLSQISDNYHRTPKFFSKIEKILNYIKDGMLKNFSNFEIFKLFSNNKRTLLFLIEEKIITIDETIASIMMRGKYKDAKYPEYFAPELKPFAKLEPQNTNPYQPKNNQIQQTYFPSIQTLGNPQMVQMQNYPQMMQMVNNPAMMMQMQNYPQIAQMPNYPQMMQAQNYPQMVQMQNYPQIGQMQNYPQMMQAQINPAVMMPPNHQNNQGALPGVNQTNNQKTDQNQNASDSEKFPDDFYEKRKIGENDDPICELIRNDKINDFITYVTQNKISLQSQINPSIFETNTFLLKRQKASSYSYMRIKRESIINYAAFYGSIEIFKYLQKSRILLNSEMLKYAIHGQNVEIIQLIANELFEKNNILYNECLKEAVKCHDSLIVDVINDIFTNGDQSKLFKYGLSYYNFDFIEGSLIKYSFPDLCKYDYYSIVKLLLSNNNIDVNNKIVLNFCD